MWKANIKIVDNVNNVQKEIIYEFKNLIQYLHLFNDLPNLYDPPCRCEIVFVFNYLDKREIVTNLERYILNGDQIEIVIKREIPLYMLCDCKTGDVIQSHENIKELYKIYNESLIDVMDCEILLIRRCGGKMKLIDVLDSPKRHYNECLNRLIHRYNF